MWCWWFWFAIQKPRQYDRLKWFWFAIQKPRSFHDPMVSTWDFGGLQCFCRLCTLGETERSPTSARSPASAETVFRPFHDDPEVRHTQDSPIQLDPDNTSVGGTLPIESLRFTHDTISRVFHAGNHCGSPLVGLVSDLCTDLAGIIQVSPPLQVVWHRGASPWHVRRNTPLRWKSSHALSCIQTISSWRSL